MVIGRLLFVSLVIAVGCTPAVLASDSENERKILVTYVNDGARATGPGAPYRHRKRYAISAEARRHSSQIADEYDLTQVDHWPIKHLSVYCFVYQIADGDSRHDVLEKLRGDARVESAQAMQEFQTGTAESTLYDDTYAPLQHGLATLDVSLAHKHSRGRGVRVAVIDSNVDIDHEDLQGRIDRIEHFPAQDTTPDHKHGTAVASVIGAVANNAKGIVGVAPESSVELYVACWSQVNAEAAICNSFVLAKALDTMLDDPPDVLNLSLTGPHDQLVGRLLEKAHHQGVIIVAAKSRANDESHDFPANMKQVIGVGSSESWTQSRSSDSHAPGRVFAPGEKILVAIPDNAYDFRSGSSLAAAHVSGVVALLIDIKPDADLSEIQTILERSQQASAGSARSVNACDALHLADNTLRCGG